MCLLEDAICRNDRQINTTIVFAFLMNTSKVTTKNADLIKFFSVITHFVLFSRNFFGVLKFQKGE